MIEHLFGADRVLRTRKVAVNKKGPHLCGVQILSGEINNQMSRRQSMFAGDLGYGERQSRKGSISEGQLQI